MFSSWFDHTNQGYLVAGIWQVQEYDDARMLAFSCEHKLTKVNALLRQPEKSITPLDYALQ